MALIRWSPVRDALTFENEMNQLMNGLFRGREQAAVEPVLWPAADAGETDKEYQIHLELPGMDMKDIKVQFTKDVLVIRGEKKQAEENDGRRWKVVERSFGTFERSFRFPVPVQSEKVRAKYHDGILTLSVPKAEEVTPREIQIEG